MQNIGHYLHTPQVDVRVVATYTQQLKNVTIIRANNLQRGQCSSADILSILRENLR